MPGPGVPVRAPEGSRASPVGKLPEAIEKVAVGKPLVRTLKEPGMPAVKLALWLEMKEGAWFTVRRKDWVLSGFTPLVALMVKEWVPPDPGVGVPEMVPEALRVSPPGRAPDEMEKTGAGNPVAKVENEPERPVVKVAWLAEVMAGA